MANIFAAITAVLLALSAYFAYQNHELLQIEVGNSEVAKNQLDISRQRLVDLRDERDGVIADRRQTEATQAERDQVKAELTLAEQKLTRKFEEAQDEITKLDQRVAELEKEQDVLEQNRGLIERIKRTRSEVESLEREVETRLPKLETDLVNLLEVKQDTEQTIRGYRSIDRAFSQQNSYFEQARIASIYPSWGFVTLDSGHLDGVVTNSTLAIVRGEDVIGNLRVRAVESQGASAELIPGSLAEGVTLMVGDRVVPASSNNDAEEPRDTQPQVEPAPAPDVPSQPAIDEDIDFGF